MLYHEILIITTLKNLTFEAFKSISHLHTQLPFFQPELYIHFPFCMSATCPAHLILLIVLEEECDYCEAPHYVIFTILNYFLFLGYCIVLSSVLSFHTSSISKCYMNFNCL
jgi:hypothetical protein